MRRSDYGSQLDNSRKSVGPHDLDDARDRLAGELGAAARELLAKIDRIDGATA
jgi:hypothetical protein